MYRLLHHLIRRCWSLYRLLLVNRREAPRVSSSARRETPRNEVCFKETLIHKKLPTLVNGDPNFSPESEPFKVWAHSSGGWRLAARACSHSS